MTAPQPEPLNEYAYNGGGATKLGRLLAQFDAKKDAADKAKAELEDLTKAIKAELTGNPEYTQPDGAPFPAYTLATAQLAKPLTLKWIVSERLDSSALRATYPDIANQFTTPSGAWYLRRSK